MYNRYKDSYIQSLTITQQIAVILKDINKKLQTSDDLFLNYKVAESIEIGEKAVYKAIALAEIMNVYITQALSQPKLDAATQKGLADLQHHFEVLYKIIHRYLIGRNQQSLAQISNNLQAMAKFWEDLPG